MFGRVAIEHAPDDPGVIILWDAEEVIYVGGSREETIKAALLRHLDGASADCARRATHYSWEITLRPAEREAELLKEFARTKTGDPRCQQKLP